METGLRSVYVYSSRVIRFCCCCCFVDGQSFNEYIQNYKNIIWYLYMSCAISCSMNLYACAQRTVNSSQLIRYCHIYVVPCFPLLYICECIFFQYYSCESTIKYFIFPCAIHDARYTQTVKL